MKKLLIFLVFFAGIAVGTAQSTADKEQVTKACMNYIEGFYEGDTLKLTKALKPSLYKYGYSKRDGKFRGSQMTFDAAKNYAKSVLKNKRFAKADAPKEVKILDINHNIAAAKVTAWWGYDYILLSKVDGNWMIEQVLWEGPLKK